MYDIIIVGAGPAGMTAALYALRANKNVLLLEKENFGGQITYSPKVENFPTYIQMSGSEFADKLLEQIMSCGAVIELAEALKIEEMQGHFLVNTDVGNFEGRAVILATGSKHKKLGTEREDDFVGKGVSYCAVCDGAFFYGKDIAIVGGGNTAMQEAIMMSDQCGTVYIVQNLAKMTGEQRLIDAISKNENIKIYYSALVTEFIGENELCGIRIKNTDTGKEEILDVEGIFVAIGQKPENEAFADFAKLDKFGYIISDESCTTDKKGIFTAGDCRTKSVRQITTAVADGTVAALAACNYLEALNS